MKLVVKKKIVFKPSKESAFADRGHILQNSLSARFVIYAGGIQESTFHPWFEIYYFAE